MSRARAGFPEHYITVIIGPMQSLLMHVHVEMLHGEERLKEPLEIFHDLFYICLGGRGSAVLNV